MQFLTFFMTAIAIQMLGMLFKRVDLWSLDWWLLILASLCMGYVVSWFYILVRKIEENGRNR